MIVADFYIFMENSKMHIFKKGRTDPSVVLFVPVVNVKEEPGTVAVSSTSVGGMGVPSGMMGSTTPTGVSTTGFAPMEFQSRSKCFM